MARYHRAPVHIHTTPYFKRTTTMPSPRRVKIFVLLIFLFVITLLFYTASLRQSRVADSRTLSDFYSKTVNALDKIPPGSDTGSGSGSGRGEDDEKIAKSMAERLKEAAQVAKDNANAKAPRPDPPSAVVGVGSAEKGVAGRKKYPIEGASQDVMEEKKETQEEHEVEEEMNSILRRAPIIIFSKSYCPHSKRAKTILLEKYTIDPPPFVVELDQHPLGSKLQARLAEKTGRRTVPNVLVNAVSIGGGDDVAALDESKGLAARIRDLAGKKVFDVSENGEGGHGLR